MDVVYWDENRNCWNNEGIELKKKKKSMVQFRFKNFINTPHAVVIRRDIDFPFSNFFIRNTGDAIYIDIETKRINLKFKISMYKDSS